MTEGLARRTYTISGAAVALLVAALLVPRLFAGTGDGFGRAAAAALTFLALAAAAAVLSIVSSAWALRNRARLPVLAVVAGVLPLGLVLLSAGVVAVLITR
jgi:hypothetical protein